MLVQAKSHPADRTRGTAAEPSRGVVSRLPSARRSAKEAKVGPSVMAILSSLLLVSSRRKCSSSPSRRNHAAPGHGPRSSSSALTAAMNPIHNCKAFAPSSNLLKYLRAQTHGYTTSVSSRATQDVSLHRLRHRGCLIERQHQHPAPRSDTARRCRQVAAHTISTTSLESSLLALGSIWSGAQVRKFGPSYFSQNDLPSFIHDTTAVRPISDVGQTRSFSRSRSAQQEYGNNGWWKNWNRKRWMQRPRTELHPNDLPQQDNFMDDGASFGRILRPANELKLRCTEFDEHGNVTLVNGEFKKSELIAKYGLLPRDLRKIDSSLLPNVLVRPSAILINLLHLRVLIKSDRVLVLDAYGSTDTYTQSLFMYDLEGKLRSIESRSSSAGHLPYEFRALESVLISVTTSLETEFEGVRGPVVRVLRELEEDIDRDKLRELLIYSKKLSSFEQKARLVRDAIDDLLEADDDLAAMYLTEKANGATRPEDDHTEVEMLLESYYKLCDEIVQVSSNLVNNIRNTEEIVKAILDANRNSLMLLDLKFSVGTLGIGAGTFVAALYGMNLKNFIEDSDYGFWGVSVWCTVFSVFVCYYGLKKLRSIQRVSMWGGARGGTDLVNNSGGLGAVGAERARGIMSPARRERLKMAKDNLQHHGILWGPGAETNPGQSPASGTAVDGDERRFLAPPGAMRKPPHKKGRL